MSFELPPEVPPEGTDETLDAVRRANPVPAPVADELPHHDVERLIDDILHDRTNASRAARALVRERTSFRPRKLGLTIGAVVFVAGGTATAAVLQHREPTQSAFLVACRGGYDADASAVVIEASDDPIGGCANVWRRGMLPDPASQGPRRSDAPPLIACIGRGGAIEVFPAQDDSGCGSLELAPAPPILSEASRRVILLEEALVSATAGACRSVDETVTVAELALVELELEGWRVERNPVEDPEDVCAVVGLDAPTRVVFIGAGRPPRSASQTGVTR